MLARPRTARHPLRTWSLAPEPIEPADITQLAVITPVFNPAGYSQLYRNFHVATDSWRRQGAHVWPVEVLYPGQRPNIPGALRLRATSWLWHKEAAINRQLEKLPARYDAVAWIDADILFRNEGWVSETIHLLKSYAAVQLFERARQLYRSGRPTLGTRRWAADPQQIPSGAHPGYGWAARRSLLQLAGGWWEDCITGGGDSFFALACHGAGRCAPYYRNYSAANLSTLWIWHTAVAAVTRGRPWRVSGTVDHLHHGSLGRRAYRGRQKQLRRSGFNPARHLRRNADGLPEWNAAAHRELPALIEWMEQYFHQRQD